MSQSSQVRAGCLLVGLLAGAAFAQMNVAEVAGIVGDPSGGAVARASVVAVNAGTNVKFASVTDDAGQYRLVQLPPGEYSLTVTADGFQQAIEQHIVMHAGDRVSQPFMLAVGQKTQVLVVEGVPGLLQTESAQLKDVIENQQVVDLPARDREFLELAMLGPGVVNVRDRMRYDNQQ